MIAYNEFAEPASYTVTDGASTLYDMTLAYDNLGRITHKTEVLGGTTVGFEYFYDAASRLEEVRAGAGACDQVACTLVESYTYDANGNRLTVTDAGGVTNATYDAQDRLLTYGATTYSYTAAGELASRTNSAGTTTYTYDVLGNLRAVELPDATLIEYLIDGQNRRVAKLINGAMTQGWLYRDGPGPIAELGADGVTVTARFVYATKSHVPDYMVKGGNTYRFVTDQLGSVRAVVDVSDGSVVQQIDYDAWGRPTLVSGTWDVQPFGYAGGLYDSDTGLVRFGARDYDAEVGRWTAKDPVLFQGGTANIYEYANNMPTTGIDPSGTTSQPLFNPCARKHKSKGHRECMKRCEYNYSWCFENGGGKIRCQELWRGCARRCENRHPSGGCAPEPPPPWPPPPTPPGPVPPYPDPDEPNTCNPE